jgi:hypothetical protein
MGGGGVLTGAEVRPRIDESLFRKFPPPETLWKT